MKMGERGQVTIPKKFRDRFGLGPNTEVEFSIQSDKLVLRKAAKHLALDKWIGKGKGSLEKMGYKTTDEFIRDIRGR